MANHECQADFYNSVDPAVTQYLTMTEWTEPLIALWLYAEGYTISIREGNLSYLNPFCSGLIYKGDRVHMVTETKVIVRDRKGRNK